MPRSHNSFENRSRSSARSIESGDVPRIFTPAACSGSARFSGVCPPSCTTPPPPAPSPPPGAAPARLLLARNDRRHVFERQRLEIQPVDGVVVGRHRLGVAV